MSWLPWASSGKKDDRNFDVVIYEEDYKELCAWVLRKPHIETGGDLFGLWAEKYSAVIQLALGPGKGCRRTSVSFYQDVKYLEEVGSYLTQNEGICHIGEWHSHHQLGLAHPSGGDERTVWNNMPTYNLTRFVIFIANIESSQRNYNVNIGCFLFEIDSNGDQLPVLPGTFKILHAESPFSRKMEVNKKRSYGEEEKTGDETNVDIKDLKLREKDEREGKPFVSMSRPVQNKKRNYGEGAQNNPPQAKKNKSQPLLNSNVKNVPTQGRSQPQSHQGDRDDSEASDESEEAGEKPTTNAAEGAGQQKEDKVDNGEKENMEKEATDNEADKDKKGEEKQPQQTRKEGMETDDHKNQKDVEIKKQEELKKETAQVEGQPPQEEKTLESSINTGKTSNQDKLEEEKGEDSSQQSQEKRKVLNIQENSNQEESKEEENQNPHQGQQKPEDGLDAKEKSVHDGKKPEESPDIKEKSARDQEKPAMNVDAKTKSPNDKGKPGKSSDTKAKPSNDKGKPGKSVDTKGKSSKQETPGATAASGRPSKDKQGSSTGSAAAKAANRKSTQQNTSKTAALKVPGGAKRAK